MRATAIALTLAALACSPVTRVRPSHNARMVKTSLIFNTVREWEASPWWRPSDGYIIFPIFVVLDGNRNACVVDAGVWALQPHSELYECDGKWLAPRMLVR